MPPNAHDADAPWLIGRGDNIGAWYLDGHLVLVQFGSGVLRLYNASALAIWLLLVEGLSKSELIRRLALLYDAKPEVIWEDVCALLEEWFELGLLSRHQDTYHLTYQINDLSIEPGAVDASAGAKSLTCHQRPLNSHRAAYRISLSAPIEIEIEAADDAQSFAIYQRLCTILDGFPRSLPPVVPQQSLGIRIQDDVVTYAEACADSQAVTDPTEVIGQTLLRLLRLGYPQESVLASIHVAAVGHPKTNDGVIFPGVSGAGKSTLAVALSERGWRYLGDDVVGLSGMGAIMPLPTAASLKPNSWELFARHHAVLKDRPLITYSGKSAKYLPLATDHVGTQVVPLNRWILPVYEPGSALKAEDVSPSQLLQGLMEAGMGLSGPLDEVDVDNFLQILHQIPAQRVAYSSLDEVSAWLEHA